MLSKGDECNLPKVTVGNINKNVGEKVGERELTALKIIQGVYIMYQVGEGELSQDGLTVILKDGQKVLFPVNIGEPEVLLGALRLIYAKIENEGSDFREIDLRFENPVLR